MQENVLLPLAMAFLLFIAGIPLWGERNGQAGRFFAIALFGRAAAFLGAVLGVWAAGTFFERVGVLLFGAGIAVSGVFLVAFATSYVGRFRPGASRRLPLYFLPYAVWVWAIRDMPAQTLWQPSPLLSLRLALPLPLVAFSLVYVILPTLAAAALLAPPLWRRVSQARWRLFSLGMLLVLTFLSMPMAARFGILASNTIQSLAYLLVAVAFFVLDRRITTFAAEFVLDNLPNPVLILNAKNEIVEVNPAVVRGLGMPLGEILGRPIEEVCPTLAEVLELGITVETRFEMKERLWAANESVLPSPFGNEEWRALILTDVTHSRRMQEALERAQREMERLQKQWETVINELPQVIALLDECGCVIRANQTLTEWTGHACPSGTALHTALHPQCTASVCYVEALWRDAQKSLAAGNYWEYEVQDEILNRRLLYRFMSVSAPTDEPIFALLIEDVTERYLYEEELRRARDEAEAANRAKSAFLANMSHELRTPLNAIIGYSELLYEDAIDAGDKDMASDLKKIHSAGRHLLTLINDVLDISKIEAGRMQVSLEEVAIRDVIDSVVYTVSGLIEQNGNTFECVVDENVGVIRTDATKLRQILLNLLGNAAKFTEQGKVALRIWRERGKPNDEIVFEISDTGIGIPEEKLPTLFQPFTQVDPSPTRKYGGTGLGLAITKAYVDMLGGTIEVQSEVGKGTTFLVRLPVVSTLVEEALTLPETLEDDTNVLPVIHPDMPVVLVIDDDRKARELMARVLRKEGFAVVEAASGAAGIRLAQEIVPDVIVLDVFMPETDGWMVLQSLKQDRTTADIPVILCTVATERELALALGAAEFIQKPVEYEELARRVRYYVGKSQGEDGGAPRVLVVEDDASMRELLVRLLGRMDIRADEAQNGREALEYVRAHPPVLILLDLMMPEMDGFEFLKHLRADPGLAGIPVIVVTARDLSPAEREQLRRSTQEIIQKGAFDRSQFLNIVHHALQSSTARTAEQSEEEREE
ncbi:hypothetical protein ARMA_0057 [Ardenticatena maritima]|uniref:Circadian input-output histidine kinase CikA n=1 Tax=Ardenticatena maritima TaxID=872965 RepID=A0A0N0RF77_9CHLR|nr:response regulator [Ardenticatena maritima]GAP61634.1 hypothetical protein ARMA_0057 [Ardenticatena maritima]